MGDTGSSDAAAGDKPVTKSQKQMEKESWDAYWTVMEIETRGNPFKRIRYLMHRGIDAPVTWFREKVLDPLHEKNKWPYYHKKFNRVPSVDQCKVGDYVCLHEANWQYKLDKAVDAQILCILRDRQEMCTTKYGIDNWDKCAKVADDFEEAELNFYIKYGEIGMYGDAIDAYMKQKHRMIWERRHPKIMKMRDDAYKVHKENMKNGIYDMWFWKRGYVWQFRNYSPPLFRNENQDRMGAIFRDDLSQDPYYYKEREETGKREPHEGWAPWDTFP